MNELFALLAAHRSIRRFRPTRLDDAVLTEAVRAAQQASTSSHIQGYSVLRVEDPVKREALVELTGGQRQVADAGAFLVLSGDQRRHRQIAERLGKPYAPNLETFLLCVIDTALFAQNLVLAFESLGLGCCYIGGLRNRLPEADALLELPHDVFPLFGLCVGEPAEDPARRPRLPVEAVLFQDRYPTPEEMWARIEDHDADMAEYYRARGAEGRNWTGGVWRKFQAPIREHLAAFYTSKGARLE